MQKKNVVLDEVPVAPAITPDSLAQLKKEDMKQAIVERFKVKTEVATARANEGRRMRSPHWQPADEEC